MTHSPAVIETLSHPLTGHKTHLLSRGALGLLVDPQPEMLPRVLASLRQTGVTPVAVLETTIRAASGAPSPARVLARTMGWPWVGPVMAWRTQGAVLEFDGQHIELAATAARHTILDLDPFMVVAQPVEGRPGHVALLVASHLFTGLPEGEHPTGVIYSPNSHVHPGADGASEERGVEDRGWHTSAG